jgi:hypothetical protein
MSSAAYHCRILLESYTKRIGGFLYQSFERDQKPFLAIAERNGVLHVCSGKFVKNCMRHTITLDFWQIAWLQLSTGTGTYLFKQIEGRQYL